MNPIAIIISILSKVAPVVTRALSGVLGSGWIATAISLLAQFLNCNPTAEDVRVALSKIDAEKLVTLAAIDAKLQEMMLACDVKLAEGQDQLDLQDAQSPDKFRAYWRPLIGWACACSFCLIVLWDLILMPILATCGVHIDQWQKLLQDGFNIVLYFTPGMLGLGGMRTFEKFKGVN